MSLSVKDRKLLWTKAGNLCSYRHDGIICDNELILSENGNYVIIGEECHIVDQKPSTSRYIKDFPNRDSYENLILLCEKHHKIIDAYRDMYTIEVLKKMKEEHEDSFAKRLKKMKLVPS